MASATCLLLLTGLLLVAPGLSFVEELSDSFMKNRDQDQIWLIMFYAPWCSFCKQLDPLWRRLGSELKNQGSDVLLGTVDATRETGLSTEFRVRTYPHIVLLKKELKYNYIGPKTRDSLLDFISRVSGPCVRSLSSVSLVEKALSRHNVMFLFIGATSELKSNFSAVAQELIVHTNFYSTRRDFLPKSVSVSSFPVVLVFKDGSYFPYSVDSGLDLKTWINRERFQSFSKLDSYQLYSLGDSGRLVLVAVLGKSRSEQSLRLKTLVQTVSSESRTKYSEFYFGFLEETDFVSGLMMSDDITVPLLLVLNLTNDGYFLPPVAVETEEELRSFLDAVVGGTLQGLGGNSVPQRIKRVLYDLKTSLTPLFQEAPVLGGVLMAVPSYVILFVVMLCFRMRRSATDDDDDDQSAAAAVSRATARKHKRKKSD